MIFTTEKSHLVFLFFDSFLIQSRPLSVSMGNAIKHVKMCISNVQPDVSEDTVSHPLLSYLYTFLLIVASLLTVITCRLKRSCMRQ